MTDYIIEALSNYRVKMDATALQGIIPYFPVAAHTGRLYFAAAYYEWLLQEEAKKKKNTYETPETQRRRLVEEVEARIVRDEADDLFVITL